MTEDELRKFDKETLVQYLVRESYYRHSVLEKLQNIEKELKFKKLMEENRKLLDIMHSNYDIKNYQKWNEAFEKSQKISKQINKMLGVQ